MTTGIASRRSLLLIVLLALAGSSSATAADAGDQTLRSQYPGTPVPGLTAGQLRVYERGEILFSKLWTAADGLGPGFNADSCMTCHHNPLPGGNEFAPSRFVVHASSCSDASGGHSCQRFRAGAGGEVQPLAMPDGAIMRKPQSLFGLGMLEAVADSDLEALAARQRRDPDGVRGVTGRTLDGRIGRFGWKARFARIDDFVAFAFNGELGMTSREYPDDGSKSGSPVEVDSAVIDDTSQFLRKLAAPPLTPRGDVSEGQRLMQSIRCTACHVPSLRTGPSKVPLLSNRTIQAHTDLLLHDMGRPPAHDGAAGRFDDSRFRTPPLWGLNASGPPYLHDGRAASVKEAILMHGGEATKSIERFKALDDAQMESLLKYLNSL